MPTPPASPCSPLSPVTSCCRRCTAPTASPPCTASSTWASRPSSIASAVVGVIGQRLLRRICDTCKEPYTPGRRRDRRVPPAQRRQRQVAVLPRRRLQLLRRHRLPRPHRCVRAAAHHARAASPDRRLGNHRRTAPSRRRPRHAHDAARRHGARRERRHHQSPKSSRPCSPARRPRQCQGSHMQPSTPRGASVEGVTKADTLGDARASLAGPEPLPGQDRGEARARSTSS